MSPNKIIVCKYCGYERLTTASFEFGTEYIPCPHCHYINKYTLEQVGNRATQ